MADLRQVFRTFKTDAEKEKEGAWVEVPLDGGGTIRVRIRPWLNSQHAAAYLAGMAPHQKELDEETLADDVVDRVHAQSMVGTVLMDWELEHDGNEIPMLPEHAEAFLIELPKFREGVAAASRKRAAFLDENLEAAAERLGKLFVGKSATAKSSKTRATKKD